MERMELNITKEQNDRLKSLVERGIFSSKQEAIRVAIAKVYLMSDEYP